MLYNLQQTFPLRFNRYIVECKYYIDEVGDITNGDLIDT